MYDKSVRKNGLVMWNIMKDKELKELSSHQGKEIIPEKKYNNIIKVHLFASAVNITYLL